MNERSEGRTSDRMKLHKDEARGATLGTFTRLVCLFESLLWMCNITTWSGHVIATEHQPSPLSAALSVLPIMYYNSITFMFLIRCVDSKGQAPFRR